MLNVELITAAEQRFAADCSSVCQPIAKPMLVAVFRFSHVRTKCVQVNLFE
jgi:hypothetical protein